MDYWTPLVQRSGSFQIMLPFPTDDNSSNPTMVIMCKPAETSVKIYNNIGEAEVTLSSV